MHTLHLCKKMAQEKWQKVKDIFVDVMQQKPEVRQELLERVCDNDKEIRREVESLLSSYDGAESFMETPATVDFGKTQQDKTPQLIKEQILGHYKIIEQIGTGGMGEVYLAKDTKLDRKVAIKILHETFSEDQSNLQRFIQEAKTASGLNHPNILVIHEIGETESSQYIVSEHIEGKTLREFTKNKSLKLTDVLDYSLQIAGALSAAHKADLVHRDIKPENIMIRPDGFVKILDFGLAKLIEQKNLSVSSLENETLKQNQTAKGVIMGTVNYMSPEQTKGKKVDERTDIFSFGVVLYEMITGHNPFASETTSETIAAILKSNPKPLNSYVPNIPQKLEEIVNKSLRKDSKKRYQNAKDLLNDLQELKQDLEFEAKLEQSVQPNLVRFDENKGEKTAIIKEQDSIEQKATTAEQRNISSAEYITQSVKQNKFAAFGVLTVLFLSFFGFGYYKYFSAESQITSIAVLPFENGNDDENLEYLSDGLSEDLINRLSQLPQLKVISRQSSFQFNSKDANFQEIGNKLDVEAVVAGKILKVGDQLTIRVEMVDTSDNKQIWGERYVKTVDDVLEIQNEIARIVSEKLRLQLTGQQKQEVTTVGTDSDEAYQLYLNGKIMLKSVHDGAVDKAIDFFEKSIELDPNFALPYTELASLYISQTWISKLDPKEAIPKVKEFVQKAFELNPNLADAHFVSGEIKRHEWDFEGAKRQFEKATELSPNNTRFLTRYSWFLSQMGEHEKALSYNKKAQMVDPLLTGIIRTESLILIEARRPEEAIEKLRNIIELEPDNSGHWVVLGFALSANGNYKEAIKAYKKRIELDYEPNELAPTHIFLGAAYALDGNREKALEILRKLEEKDRTKEGYISYTEFAVIYAALGDKDKAFQMLEKAYDLKDFQLITLNVERGFDSLRDDPRFTDLARRVGLPQAK
jgi:serine/threonine-protein kinase